MLHKGLAIRINVVGEDHVDTAESYDYIVGRTMYAMNDEPHSHPVAVG